MSSASKPSAFETVRPVIVLVAICVVAGALLGIVHDITQPIADAIAEERAQETYAALVPEAASFESLDCTVDDRRMARAAVSVDVLRADRGARTVILSGKGDSRDGDPDGGVGVVTNGDYTAAFSQAFDAALAGALQSLKAPKQASPQSFESKPKGEQK